MRPPRQPENLDDNDEKLRTRNSSYKMTGNLALKYNNKKISKDFEYQSLQYPNSSYIFGNEPSESISKDSAKPHALVPVRRITNATLRRRLAQDRIRHVRAMLK